MQYILFVILSFLIGTILFYLSNNICEPFTIGNDIQISQNLNLTSKSPCECATEFTELKTDGNGHVKETETKPHKIYKVTQDMAAPDDPTVYFNEQFTNNGILCIESNVVLQFNDYFTNNGTIYNNGVIIYSYNGVSNNSSGTIENLGTMRDMDWNSTYPSSPMENYGKINNNSSGTILNRNTNILNYNIINNEGDIKHYGKSVIDNSSGATINNSSGATITNCADFNNYGEITNNGSICSIKPTELNVEEGGNKVKLCTNNDCECNNLSGYNCTRKDCFLMEFSEVNLYHEKLECIAKDGSDCHSFSDEDCNSIREEAESDIDIDNSICDFSEVYGCIPDEES